MHKNSDNEALTDKHNMSLSQESDTKTQPNIIKRVKVYEFMWGVHERMNTYMSVCVRARVCVVTQDEVNHYERSRNAVLSRFSTSAYSD